MGRMTAGQANNSPIPTLEARCFHVDIRCDSRNTPLVCRCHFLESCTSSRKTTGFTAERSGHGMTQDPRLRQAVPTSASSWNDKTVQQPPSSAPNHENGLTGVARTLAAYGGESVAFDLALDLVLNEVVEQARAATGATGAAIALARNGVMECRPTTGQDAPDLGVRVETETGLSGACLRTGEVQDCSDTETDPRVDAEACRWLGVRSMLILALSDGTKAFGILEVLSSKPHAFGPEDIEALKTLARRIVESKAEAERGVAGLFAVEEHQSEPAAPAEKLPEKVVEIKPQGPIPVPAKANIAIDDPEPATRVDLWTTVLVILVIVTAVALGLLIGWRYAARKHVAARTAARAVSSQPDVPPTPPVPVTKTQVLPDRAEQVKQTREEVSSNQADSSTTSPPPGGLVVTQNGKVIYRSQPGARPIAPAPGTVI